MCIINTAKRRAELKGKTELFFVSDGMSALYLWLRPEADLDDTLEGICAETGEALAVAGWQATDIDRMTFAAFLSEVGAAQ